MQVVSYSLSLFIIQFVNEGWIYLVEPKQDKMCTVYNIDSIYTDCIVALQELLQKRTPSKKDIPILKQRVSPTHEKDSQVLLSIMAALLNIVAP